MTSFKELGILPELCAACERLGWDSPTEIQKEAIPIAVKGNDVIGLAETGSGKTAAFCLPLLQRLLLKPRRCFAVIIVPTQELALQIKQHLDALGKDVGIVCAVIVGGMDMQSQTIELKKKPHVIVATPGRLVDHLEDRKQEKTEFSLKLYKFLVLDEADVILNMEFGDKIAKIMNSMSSKRQTLLFSATMTSKVAELQRAHLSDPVKIEVSSKFQTVQNLWEYMLFIPFRLKIMYLVAILKKIGSTSVIIFCNTYIKTLKTSFMLNYFGIKTIPLYGKMSRIKRGEALKSFKEKNTHVLVATDVCSRGLDIADVNYIINFDVPMQSQTYIHRVGRTARAGKSGIAITLVSQYDIETYQRMEHALKFTLPVYKDVTASDISTLANQLTIVERHANIELKKIEDKIGKNSKRPFEESGECEPTEKRFKKNKKRK